MSRGLTDNLSPEPQPGVTLNDVEEAIEELFGLVSALYAKVDTVEKIIGSRLDLPELEALDRKRVTGL